jgi:nucleotide-binding universal stress UspA family protein
MRAGTAGDLETGACEHEDSERYGDCFDTFSMGHIHKILAPMDGSLPSIAALAQAVTLAEDLGASVSVIHVKAPDRFEVGSATAVAASPEEHSDREMEEAVATAKARLGERLTQRIVVGDPVQKVLEIAVADSTDLIVMGTHGRVGRLQALIGSVAAGVVRSSPCPVLTVREPDGEAESFSERIHGRPSLADRLRSTR